MPGRGKITTAIVLPIFAALFMVLCLYMLIDRGINAVNAGTITWADFLARYITYLIVCWVLGFILNFVSLGLIISSIRDYKTGFRIFWLILTILGIVYSIASVVYTLITIL